MMGEHTDEALSNIVERSITAQQLTAERDTVSALWAAAGPAKNS
nr:hypothetical protein [Rhodococcus sp. 06-621-2]